MENKEVDEVKNDYTCKNIHNDEFKKRNSKSEHSITLVE